MTKQNGDQLSERTQTFVGLRKREKVWRRKREARALPKVGGNEPVGDNQFH